MPSDYVIGQVPSRVNSSDDGSATATFFPARDLWDLPIVYWQLQPKLFAPEMQMDEIPAKTRYTRSGDVHIAYQVVGEGTFDLVFVPGWVSHVELAWEEPTLAKFLRRWLHSRA